MDAHAVLVTFPVRSHVFPLLHFAKALASQPRLTVTLVNNRFFHDLLVAREGLCPTESGKLRLEQVDDGLSPDFDFNDVWPRMEEFHQCTINMQASLKVLIENLNRKNPPVSCVVFGSFFVMGHLVAKDLGLPSVFFWSQSAAVFSIYRHMPLLVANGFFPYKNTLPESRGDDSRLLSFIPGVQSLYPEEFPTFFRVKDLDDKILTGFRKQFEVLQDCSAIVINSFHDLEKEVFDVLQPERCPLFAVGPLLSSKKICRSSEDGVEFCRMVQTNGKTEKREECLKWLDSQRNHSVLYICFGSLWNPTPEDIREVALALRETKQPFIWSIQVRSFYSNSSCTVSQPRSIAEILPERFLDDTRDYGVIIPWVPQEEVLGHPSVGAFLTHCGWNSVLEGLSMGVPMITLPTFSDQTTNAKYIVDVWKVGMRLSENASVDSADLVRVLNCIFCTEQGPMLRERAGQIKEAAGRALEMNSKNEIKEFCSWMMSLGSHKRASGP